MKARRIRVYDTVIETYEVLVPVGTNHDEVDEILAEGDFARMDIEHDRRHRDWIFTSNHTEDIELTTEIKNG